MISTDIALLGFDYASSDLVASIRRNLTALLATPAGTCAGDRSYGISAEYVDKPVEAADNYLALEIIEKVAVYEPRVELADIRTALSENGVVQYCTFRAADAEDGE